MQQHAGACVIDVQEALQIGEGIGTAQFFHAGVGQRHTVALCQREDHLGLERALDVDVQFGLGHGPQQARQAFGGNGRDLEHRQAPKNEAATYGTSRR